MREVCVVVEGQSEEQFVKQVLSAKALARGVAVTPVIVRTRRTATKTYKGGGSSWQPYKSLVNDLAGQRHLARIGVMFDLYACPKDTPGLDPNLSGSALHRSVVAATHADLDPRGSGRIVSGPVLHEYETLVIAAIATGETEAEPAVVTQAQAAIDVAGGAEAINGSRDTAPSKRLAIWWPGYEKVLYGAVLLSQAPWDQVTARCPTFHAWWETLLAES